MSFAIEKFTPALLRSVNIRAEMHGNEPVPAADLYFVLTGSNDVLDQFDTGLKGIFYMPASGKSKTPELPGVEAVTSMPQLRSTSIEMPVPLSREYLGRNLVIDFGLGGKSNIELSACDVNNFKVSCQEGGTVETTFRVQASGLDEKTLGKISSLVKHEVKITLVASEASDNTQEVIPGTKKAGKAEPKKDATDLFIVSGVDAPVPEKKAPAKKVAAKKVVPPRKSKVAPLRVKMALAAKKAKKK
jgi:hypothetical protein